MLSELDVGAGEQDKHACDSDFCGFFLLRILHDLNFTRKRISKKDEASRVAQWLPVRKKTSAQHETLHTQQR